MYCPRCGQQQLSETVRFCTRCGFSLSAVTQLLANDGKLPGNEAEEQTDIPSPRRRGVRKGLRLMIIAGLLVPIVALMTALGDAFAVLFLPVFACFVIGLARLLYALLMHPKVPALVGGGLSTSDTLGGRKGLDTGRVPTLPPPHNVSGTSWRQQMDTGEMTEPPSVTENTTRLLEDEAGESRAKSSPQPNTKSASRGGSSTSS